MGRMLQKKKQRSSRPKIKQSQKLKKALNPMGNSLIAKNWDKKQTLSQNYRRLGLVARLQAPTGGVEARHEASNGGAEVTSRRAPTTTVFGVRAQEKPVLKEARVERDETGRIIRVLREPNPLNDLLNDFDSDNDAGVAGTHDISGKAAEWGGLGDEDEDDDPRLVRELERQAAQPVEKRRRHQSEREIEWLQRLVDKHGDNTAAMARDARLNRMQQTEADIAKRLRQWQDLHASAA